MWLLRVIAFCFAVCVSFAANAQICSTSLPYTFVNGTTIDATQVNANLQAIIACVNSNAAHNGTNTDITSFTGVTSGQLVPSGTLAYFDLSSCPSGWSLANGSGGTLDARGRFLRATNQGSGRDPANPALGGTETATNGSVTASLSGTAAGQAAGSLVTLGGGVSWSLTTGSVVTSIYGGGASLAVGSGWGFSAGGSPVTGTITAAPQGITGSTSASSISGSISCTNCGAEARPQSIALTACQKN